MALCVRAQVYGRCVGHLLMQAAIGQEAAYLWVLEGNIRAVAFYERLGFCLDGATKSAAVGREQRMMRGPS